MLDLVLGLYITTPNMNGKFEDTKVVFRSRKSKKNRQYTWPKEKERKDKQ
jgi:hypothetical protein